MYTHSDFVVEIVKKFKTILVFELLWDVSPVWKIVCFYFCEADPASLLFFDTLYNQLLCIIGRLASSAALLKPHDDVHILHIFWSTYWNIVPII